MILSDDARQARNEYIRQYRAANKDKVRRWNATYWQRKADQRKADKADKKETKDAAGHTER